MMLNAKCTHFYYPFIFYCLIEYRGQTSSQVMLIFMEMKMTDNVASVFFFFFMTATSIFLAFHNYAELAY